MPQFLRDQASDSEEVVTPLMLDGTYLSRNFATLGPLIGQPPCVWSLFLPSKKEEGTGGWSSVLREGNETMGGPPL